MLMPARFRTEDRAERRYSVVIASCRHRAETARRYNVSQPACVFEIAPANVWHGAGAARVDVIADEETQVRVDCESAEAEAAGNAAVARKSVADIS